jgi:fructosamine-3-kinase
MVERVRNNFSMLLRADCSLPLIQFATKSDIHKGLLREGWDPDRVFFKCNDFASRDIWGDGNRLVCSIVRDLGIELDQLTKIRSAFPEHVPQLIAIAQRNDREVGYFMEYLQGSTLDELYTMKQEGTPLMDKALGDLTSIAISLHTCGIGHGDLNVTNIIRCTNGKIKLIDPLRRYGETQEEIISDDINSLFFLLPHKMWEEYKKGTTTPLSRDSALVIDQCATYVESAEIETSLSRIPQ